MLYEYLRHDTIASSITLRVSSTASSKPLSRVKTYFVPIHHLNGLVEAFKKDLDNSVFWLLKVKTHSVFVDETVDAEKAELIALVKKLLAMADTMSHAPYYIVQPGLSIIKEHTDIINRLKLFDDENTNIDTECLPIRKTTGS